MQKNLSRAISAVAARPFYPSIDHKGIEPIGPWHLSIAPSLKKRKRKRRKGNQPLQSGLASTGLGEPS